MFYHKLRIIDNLRIIIECDKAIEKPELFVELYNSVAEEKYRF